MNRSGSRRRKNCCNVGRVRQEDEHSGGADANAFESRRYKVASLSRRPFCATAFTIIIVHTTCIDQEAIAVCKR